MKTLSLSALAFTLTVAASAAPTPHNWPGWRGPHYNGSSDESGLPVKFSPTENVKWSVDLPGPSASTPAIWGDHVFLSSVDSAAQNLAAICVDRKTGKVRWKHLVGSGYKPAGMGNAIQLDSRSNYSSPSPTTDGKRVIFFYGNGDLVAFNFDGKQLWRRNMQQDYGDFCFGFTFSSSPLLYDGKLYFQLLQRDHSVSGRGLPANAPSWLLALDPNTGKTLWKADRPTPAREESREAFTSPVPFVHNGRKEILLSGGDLLSGHDPATGKELWRWGTWNEANRRPDYRIVPSPVAGGGVVLGCGPKREPVFAVKAGLKGDLSTTGLAWKTDPKTDNITSDVPTPAFSKGRFYIASDVRKNIACVEASSGKVLWATPLEGPSAVWASPTVADGKVYLLSLRGEAHVLDAATGKVLSSVMMAEGENEIRSSIAVSRGNLFIRTNGKLYCIGR